MVEKLDHRGPDGNDSVLIDNTFISYHHLWITPEELGEKQPLRNSSGKIYISFDGRIDNRDEIIKLVGSKKKELNSVSDAALFLLIYEKLKENCFKKILGPYSVVIYDSKINRVIGARDKLGERGFYYYIDHNLFIAASEESAILSHPDVSKKINEKTVSYFFAFEIPRDGSTFYKGIRELLPAHYIVIESNNVTLKKYWEYEPNKIRYKYEDQYSDHFRELLEQCVRSRMRCSTPVSIMLSGGIDSSSIAAFASINNPHKKSVRAISWVFDKIKECDESNYINETCGMYDLKRLQFNADKLWPLHEPETYFQNPNTPIENAYRELKEKIYKLCSQNGSRLLFNGWYADRFYLGSEYRLLDLIRDFKINKTISEVYSILNENSWSNINKIPEFRKVFGFLRFIKPEYDPLNMIDWLTGFSRSNLSELAENNQSFKKYTNPKRTQKMFESISYASPNSEQYHLNRYAVELECPYRDMRLVEFMLNIPSYVIYSKESKKYIAQKAMNKLLPYSITANKISGSLTPLFRKGINNLKNGKLDTILNSNDEWKRYVDINWIVENMNKNFDVEKRELIIWQCISFVSWLNKIQAN